MLRAEFHRQMVRRSNERMAWHTTNGVCCTALPLLDFFAHQRSFTSAACMNPKFLWTPRNRWTDSFWCLSTFGLVQNTAAVSNEPFIRLKVDHRSFELSGGQTALINLTYATDKMVQIIMVFTISHHFSLFIVFFNKLLRINEDVYCQGNYLGNFNYKLSRSIMPWESVTNIYLVNSKTTFAKWTPNAPATRRVFFQIWQKMPFPLAWRSKSHDRMSVKFDISSLQPSKGNCMAIHTFFQLSKKEMEKTQQRP